MCVHISVYREVEKKKYLIHFNVGDKQDKMHVVGQREVINMYADAPRFDLVVDDMPLCAATTRT